MLSRQVMCLKRSADSVAGGASIVAELLEWLYMDSSSLQANC